MQDIVTTDITNGTTDITSSSTATSTAILQPTSAILQPASAILQPTSAILQPMNFGTATLQPIQIGQPGQAQDQIATGPDNTVHLWIQKRTGKKRLTLIQGLPATLDWEMLAQKLRKEFHCNCTRIEHPKIGDCIQLSGDFREDLKQMFVKDGIVRNKKNIKVHGD